ncbi:MAG TPA: response regulator [Candidatus Limnocylindria bacterium]|jgi:DNA-binding response OmpR family regulator|nr:response regulator [Candidatus Limnocylindria bacterium]
MKRVLIALDDPDTGAALKLNLEDRLPVTTDVVTNGALVLDQLTATRSDLLILDVSLPGLNGVDVFDLIRGSARCGEVPVLFVTGAPDRAREAFAHCGINDVMAKPFDGDALARRVSDLLALATAAA